MNKQKIKLNEVINNIFDGLFGTLCFTVEIIFFLTLALNYLNIIYIGQIFNKYFAQIFFQLAIIPLILRIAYNTIFYLVRNNIIYKRIEVSENQVEKVSFDNKTIVLDKCEICAYCKGHKCKYPDNIYLDQFISWRNRNNNCSDFSVHNNLTGYLSISNHKNSGQLSSMDDTVGSLSHTKINE